MNASRLDRFKKSRVQVFTPPRAILLGYAFLILLGTVLLALPISHAPGSHIDLIDALFTATSATSVTGLTVVETGGAFSFFGQIVILTLMQIGGVGLMVSVTIVAVVFGWRIGLHHRQLVEMDLNQLSIRGVVRLSIRVFLFTFALEAVGAILLFTVFGSELPRSSAVFYAVFHSISAFCGAGFDLFGEGFQRYTGNPTLALTFAALITAGGLGFSVLQDIAANKRWSRLSFHSQVVIVVTAVLTVAGTVVVFAVESANPLTLGAMELPQRLVTAFFQAVSARTAGFEAAPVHLMADPTLFAFLFLMFVGASPGSTGGGIKTTTVAILAGILHSVMRRKRDVELGRYRIDRAAVDGSLVVVLGAGAWIMVVTFLLLFIEQADVMPTLFETVSAFGTAGLSLGLTSSLSDIGKVLIAITMFVGKVGPIALVLSIGRGEPHDLTRRPEKRLIVG